MTVQSIESIFVDADRTVYVSAVIGDFVQTHAQSFHSPAEYGAGLCESYFYLDEDEMLPENEDDLISYINNLDLDWRVVDNSDYDFE